MAAGDALSPSQRHEIDSAIRDAETLSRLEFSVFVGRVEGEPRAFALRLLEALVAPERSVLVMVDPVGRLVEVVTGAQAHQTLADPEVRLTVLSMQTSFAAGDLIGGLCRGLLQLAEHARRPVTRHRA